MYVFSILLPYLFRKVLFVASNLILYAECDKYLAFIFLVPMDSHPVIFVYLCILTTSNFNDFNESVSQYISCLISFFVELIP